MNCSRRQNVQRFQNRIIPADPNRKVEYVAEIPKPMVPDLSLIIDPFDSVTVSKPTGQPYRLPSTNKQSYPHVTSPSLVTPNSDKLQQIEKQKTTTHDEEKNKNASMSSYDVWRMKNADLFSKSVTTKTNERSDRSVEDVNARLRQNIERNRRQIMNFDEIRRTENLNLRQGLEGDEDDVRRVKELYNKVFPSDRHVQSQYSRKCVDINDEIIPHQSHLSGTSPILNDQHNCKFTTNDHGNPRKDIVKKLYDNKYEELIRSKSIGYNQPVCVRQLSQNMTHHNSLIDEHDDDNDYRIKCLSTCRNQDDNNLINHRLSFDEHNVTRKCNCSDEKYVNDVCQNTRKELTSNYNTSNRYRYCCPNRECSDRNRMNCSNSETIQKRKKKNITVDELYNVVKLQNEQINLLQKQIDRLLSEQQKISKSQQEFHRSTQICDNSSHRTSLGNNQHDKFTAQGIFKAFSVVQEQNSTCHQNGCDNIMESNRTNVSIGVMTSFVAELGVTTQQYRVTDLNQNQVSSNCDDNQQPKNCRNDEMNKQDSSCKCRPNSPNELQQRFPLSNNKDIDRNGSEQIPPAKQRGFNGSLESFNRRKQVRERGNGCPVVAEEESFACTEVDLPSLSLPAVAVREHIPSPQCSLHIDIQDFDSNSTVSTPSSVSNSPSPRSDYDYKCENGVGNKEGLARGDEEEEDQGRGRVGWTFYDNVVGQVNKILEGTGSRSNTNQIAQQERPVKHHPSSAMGIAENARAPNSVQQIRQRGISFIPEEKEDEPEEEYYTNNNVSSATAKKVTFNSNNEREKHPLVNGKQSTSRFTFSDEQQILQAAMEIMRRRAADGGDVQVEKEKEMIRPPPPPPPQQLETSPDLAAGGLLSDLSFATIQYLKRYQLLPQQQQQVVQSCDKQQRLRQQSSPPVKFLPPELHCEPHRIQDRRENFNCMDVPPFTRRVMREQQQPIHNEQYNYQIMQPANKILDITALKQQPKLL